MHHPPGQPLAQIGHGPGPPWGGCLTCWRTPARVWAGQAGQHHTQEGINQHHREEGMEQARRHQRLVIETQQRVLKQWVCVGLRDRRGGRKQGEVPCLARPGCGCCQDRP